MASHTMNSNGDIQKLGAAGRCCKSVPIHRRLGVPIFRRNIATAASSVKSTDDAARGALPGASLPRYSGPGDLEMESMIISQSQVAIVGRAGG